MGDVSDLIAEIQRSFDVTPADALALLDRRHKSMCDRARWWRMNTSATVLWTPGSPPGIVQMPVNAVEIFTIEVFAGSLSDVTAFNRTRAADLPAIVEGTLVLSGPGGVFVELPPGDEVSTAAHTSLLLYPPPAAGSIALLKGAFIPPTLTTAETTGSFIRVPTEFYDGLLAGVYGSLLARPNEARPDLAASAESAFQSACGELRDRADRRYRTKGPRQIRIAGRDA